MSSRTVNHFGLGILLILITGNCAQAQRDGNAESRKPREPLRPFVVMTSQSLGELQQRLKPANKAEDLIGGDGMQLRVAVQHEKDNASATAEVHDESDDVYYVLDGSATLMLGGKLEKPKEQQPGEWRSEQIIGGRIVEINKGDVVIVPRGTPHQRTTAGKDFSMLLIKVFSEPIAATDKKSASQNKAPKP